MPRPKGLPKTGGRKPGVRNKRTAAVIEKFEERGVDPVDKLLDMAEEAEHAGRKSEAKEIYTDLLPYCWPKLKSMDVEVGINDDTLAARLQAARERDVETRQRASNSMVRSDVSGQGENVVGISNGTGRQPRIEGNRSSYLPAPAEEDSPDAPAADQADEPAPAPKPETRRRPLPGQAPEPVQHSEPEIGEPSPAWDYSPTGWDD